MNEHIKHVSTPEYLESLTIDQLRCARDLSNKIIKRIEDEAKVTLWVVSSGCCNVACFYEGHFKAAKKKLCEIIMLDEFKPKDVRGFHPEIHRRVVPESEVADWMELGQ